MSLPMVSVVIPMRNEEAWIERCLSTVLAQDYPWERVEILVADGMSTDGSRGLLAQMAESDPRIHVIDNPGLIVPTGLNLAIAAARGEIIARIDAHTVLESDYLRVGVELLQASGAANVGGPMVCRGGGPVGDAIARAMHSRFGIGAVFHFATAQTECDTVYMGMWPRQVFERVGLFDPELVRNQDDELNYRIRKAGGRILVTPAMRSSYQNRESWKALIRQFYQYGEWKVRVLQKHPRQMSVRHFVPPAFLLGVAGAMALAPLWPAAGWLAAGAVASYALAMAMVAATDRETTTLPGRARFWLALVLIHQCWAAGFVAGLVRFADRWKKTEPPPPPLSPRRAPVSPGSGASVLARFREERS